MMLTRFRIRLCPATFKKPACCGLWAHCGHAGLPCAWIVTGVFKEHQRPSASAQTAITKRFIVVPPDRNSVRDALINQRELAFESLDNLEPMVGRIERDRRPIASLNPHGPKSRDTIPPAS